MPPPNKLRVKQVVAQPKTSKPTQVPDIAGLKPRTNQNPPGTRKPSGGRRPYQA